LGETLEEAAKREFFEETGYQIDTWCGLTCHGFCCCKIFIGKLSV
jgi:8-oxo-dGTP pyrophosphatase MutT (NUDIX family)